MSFPHPPKTLVVREPPKLAETRECGTDPERFTNSHARILRRGARPSYLAFVRSRLRDVRLKLRVVDIAGRTLREETLNVDNEKTDHETAYRKFVAVADSLEAERENRGYYVYYETLSGSISSTEAANLARIGFEIDPGRVREPRKSPAVAHMKAMKAGEVDAILGRGR